MADTISGYHELSKHHPRRLAPGPDHLDWAHQPDPFRSYAGAPTLALPLVASTLDKGFDALYRPVGRDEPALMDLAGIAALFELSLGLSAWKVHGHARWALRCNPSSGNLHPTEGYLVTGGGCCGAGVHHYVSRDHRLERRRVGAAVEAWAGLLPEGMILLGLTSIGWREAWKYGVRAFRYCQLDVGHALGAVRYAAAVLGWRVGLLSVATRDVARLLGLPDAQGRGVRFGSAPEPEEADCLLVVSLPGVPVGEVASRIGELAALAEAGPWLGAANRLSDHHRFDWPEVAEAHGLSVLPGGVDEVLAAEWPPCPPMVERPSGARAADLIRRRRSAQRFDAGGWLERADFFRILDATLPRADAPPWDLLSGMPRIHPVWMVHRVRDLPAGLYVLVRHPGVLARLRVAMETGFDWTPVSGAPAHLPLYRLREGDFREIAGVLSCQQELASDCAATCGMLADFSVALAVGPWAYRRLFWEAGMVGQTLYLEAEAVGRRGTGIGCFFDDLFHQLLGLSDDAFQSLYHFTLGFPIPDARIASEPPYPGLA